MPDYDSDNPDERLAEEAEELMRQRRFRDAVARYRDLCSQAPTDLWAILGYVSALECAGEVAEAERTLEQVAADHRRSAPLHRFRHLFFVRREDRVRAATSGAKNFGKEWFDDGPVDQLADLYFNQGRYHEALAEFERLTRDENLDEPGLRAGVMARSAACLRQMGSLDDARERLISALTLEPGNHWTLAELAECERAMGNREAARRRYHEALEVDGSEQWTRGHLAQLEFEDGHPERSVKLYEEILAAEPKATWAKVELAQVLIERDPARATQLCQSALEDDATYPWAHAQLGNLARRAGRLDDARKHFQDAAAASPSATWILHELADTCRRMGRREEALTHLEHAGRLNPYDAVTHGYQADFLRQDGKGGEAVAHLEKAVQLDPKYIWAWRELAEIHALAGHHEVADKAYRQAVELDPGAAINDGLRAFLLRCQGDRVAAAGWLMRAVDAQPDYLWAWRELIDFQLSIGEPVRAEQMARAAMVHLPANHAVSAMLAEALRRQNRWSDAQGVLAPLIAANSDHPPVWAVYSQIAAGVGDLEGSVSAMRKAFELDPSSEHQALLAQVLIANGELGEAAFLIGVLMKEPVPLLPVYELEASLAERQGRLQDAIDCCDVALVTDGLRDEPRIMARRARLIAQHEPARAAEAVEVMTRLVLAPVRPGIPWRDVAQILAHAGRGSLARIACSRNLDEAAGNQRAEARAWLTLAEVELGLEQLNAAAQALEQALARDAQLMTGHLIGAVLDDLRGERDGAIRHLEELERLAGIAEASEEDLDDLAQLIQQIAGLWERLERPDRALAAWARLADINPQRFDLHTERLSFLLRQDRIDEVMAEVDDLLVMALAEDAIGGPECQRLLRDLATYQEAHNGARQALATLREYDAHLDPTTRLMAAQLALAADDLDACDHQLSELESDLAEPRATALLRVRWCLARHRFDGAETIARALWQEEHDQEAASVLAEALAGQFRYDEALAVVEHPGLEDPPSTERGLMAALLALELHGESACLARLGRLRFDRRAGLMNLLAEAWPHTWMTATIPRATSDDVLTMPPFPRAACRLAAALDRRGRPQLAGHLLEAIAGYLRPLDPRLAAPVFAAAVAPLCRAGRRRRAWSAAIASTSWQALLRCAWPW